MRKENGIKTVGLAFVAIFLTASVAISRSALPAAGASEYELSSTEKNQLQEYLQICRSKRVWKKSASSDSDYCSCTVWHFKDLIVRSQSFKFDQFLSAAKQFASTGKAATIEDQFTEQHTNWVSDLCLKDPSTQYQFPLNPENQRK